MPIFKRRAQQDDGNRLASGKPASWALCLGAAGAALDRMPGEIRDIVIVLEGGARDSGALISLLDYPNNSYQNGWNSSVYRLDTSARELMNVDLPILPGDPDTGRRDPFAAEQWELRLNAVGLLMDQPLLQISSPTVMDLGTGVLVNGIVQFDDITPGWYLRSMAYSNDLITSVMTKK